MHYDGRLHKDILNLNLEIYSEILSDMQSQIDAFPTIEVGGKYIGRLKEEFNVKNKKGINQLKNNSIEIIHSIDPGPKAKRTPVELLPDGDYQEQVFRAIEAQYPDVEHLGSWHSHHPNGLGQLSDGDIHGYFETVNDLNYNLDLFVATLIISQHGFSSARHFLFIRGESKYYEIAKESVKVVSTQNPYSMIIKKFRERTPLHKIENLRGKRLTVASPWYESPEGKQALREDREFFLELGPGFKSLKRGEILIWRGTINLSSISYEVSYEYPPDFLKSPSSIEIRSTHSPGFSIKCALAPIAHRKRLMGIIFQLLGEFDRAIKSNH